MRQHAMSRGVCHRSDMAFATITLRRAERWVCEYTLLQLRKFSLLKNPCLCPDQVGLGLSLKINLNQQNNRKQHNAVNLINSFG